MKCKIFESQYLEQNENFMFKRNFLHRKKDKFSKEEEEEKARMF